MDKQIAKLIYHRCMSIMKYTLELEEFSYREKGREDPRYKTFKKHLMANTYDNIRALLQELANMNMVEATNYAEDLKNGYKDTPSGGSGFVNTSNMDAWLGQQKALVE